MARGVVVEEEKPLLRVLHGESLPTPPIWLMRQAGRYLPEYREMRAKSESFLDFCYTPTAAAEVTLQPIRRFGFDGAILFSDILVVADALGQKVSFESGAGPRLEPLETPVKFSGLREAIDLEHLSPVFETIDRVKGALPKETTLIGFCGGPWTVASYMIAGHGTPDQAPARIFAYRHPEAFVRLIDLLTNASIAYLARQIEAGVEVVQIFDSWAGVLPPLEFQKWIFAPLEKIVASLKAKHPMTPIIVFARGASTHLTRFVENLGAEAYGLDTSAAPVWAASQTRGRAVLQGNLDPLALLVGGAALEREALAILEAFTGQRHIFNLGHGIMPQTAIGHVEQLIALVRRGSE